MASVVDRHFDYLRKQREADISKQQQMQGEDLDRTAARQGMSGSGAFVKLKGQQSQGFDTQRANAIDDVEGQRALALGEIEARDKQMNFAKEQAQLDRDFSKGESIAQRDFMKGESKAQRAFQSSEAAAERGFNKQLFDKEMEFKNRVQLEQELFNGAQMKMALKQFNLDKKVSEFNMDMAMRQWNKKEITDAFAEFWGYDTNTGEKSGGAGAIFKATRVIGQGLGG